MPRQARTHSATCIYHVMMRGINHQQIFEDQEDCYTMMQIFQNAQCNYTDDGQRLADSCVYYAYALMGNHFHLLIHLKDITLGDLVKKIASSYVYYYNRKHGRDGHLFKERFRSEPCNDMNYFITLLRYIHQNPVKAGIVTDVKDYEFTSWREYMQDETIGCPICNVNTVLRRITRQDLTALVYETLPDDVGCMDYEAARETKLSDDRLLQLLQQQYGMTYATDIQKHPQPLRDQVLTPSAATRSRRATTQPIDRNRKKHNKQTQQQRGTQTCPLSPPPPTRDTDLSPVPCPLSPINI